MTGSDLTGSGYGRRNLFQTIPVMINRDYKRPGGKQTFTLYPIGYDSVIYSRIRQKKNFGKSHLAGPTLPFILGAI
jgi:hypothetical protein